MDDDRFMEAFDILHFCGCGIPAEVGVWLLDILETIKARSDAAVGDCTQDKYAAFYDVIDSKFNNTPEEVFKYFVLYTLDAFGLTDHGCNVNGSWLSDKGEELMKKLQDAKNG